MSLWRSNSPRLTHVKIVMRRASRRLSTRPSMVSAGVAFEIDLTKKVTKESREYWYMWSIKHLSCSRGVRREGSREDGVSPVATTTKAPRPNRGLLPKQHTAGKACYASSAEKEIRFKGRTDNALHHPQRMTFYGYGRLTIW